MAASGLYIPTPQRRHFLSFSLRYRRAVPKTMLDIAVVAAVPFSTIPGAYQTLGDYMRTNGLKHVENEIIPCFETDGESMDVYMACK